MTTLTQFYNDISNSLVNTINNIDNLDDTGNIFKSLENFQEIIDEYTGNGEKQGPWKEYKLSHNSSLGGNIDEDSIIYQFKKWSNTAGKNNQMLTWEDISGGEDEIWNITAFEGEFDNTTTPVGTIYKTNKLNTNVQIDDINIDIISDKQFNKILFELIYLEKRLYQNTKNITRRDNIVNIKHNNLFFDEIPDSLKEEEEIISLKKEVIRLYAITKSKFNESEVETGFVDNLPVDFYNGTSLIKKLNSEIDQVKPVINYNLNEINDTSASLILNLNEEGKIYLVIVDTGTLSLGSAGLLEEIKSKSESESSLSPGFKFTKNIIVKPNLPNIIKITGLMQNTDYEIFMVAEDYSGNSGEIKFKPFTTTSST